MKYFFKNKKIAGFTLVETMVSVALFTVVIITGMTALLNANLLDRKSKDMRSIIDNLNFIMEDISRNARVGSTYRCYSTWNGSHAQNIILETPQSCATGKAIVFETSTGVVGDPTDQWVYKIENNHIYKSEDGGDINQGFLELNSPEIILDDSSSFSVLGAEDPPPIGTCDSSSDCQQPVLFIRLSGEIIYKDTATAFNLQTTVSQRFGDRP